jgi:hypothetical protein
MVTRPAGVGTRPGCHGGRSGPGEGPEPSPFGSSRPGLRPRRCHLCDFLQSHLLGEEVKVIRKMGDWRTPRPGCARVSS